MYMRHSRPLPVRRPRTDTEVVTKGTSVTVHITIEDNDDRSERMTRDPGRYFADARQRAVRELTGKSGGPFPPPRQPKG